MNDFIQHLEKAWENGFFFHLRYGKYNESEDIQLRKAFESFNPAFADDKIDQRLVTLIWFIPLFIKWQEERLVAAGVAPEKIEDLSNFFYNECERILGLP